jgi:transcriptional regulator
MNVPRHRPFDQWTDRDLIDLIDAFPLAWVVSPAAPLLSTPLPMLVETGPDGRPVSLLGHFAKSNPQVDRIRAEPTTLFLFTGPHGYISPELVTTTRDWGPTWNYAVARVVADVAFDETLNDEALGTLVEKMERGRAQPWSSRELGERYDQMKRGIIAFRAPIVAVEVRFKLGQDERPEILSDILQGLGGGELSRWMQRFNAERL